MESDRARRNPLIVEEGSGYRISITVLIAQPSPRGPLRRYETQDDHIDEAMHRLLSDDTPRNRAIALCHYHLTIEGVLAQTAYWGLHRSYGEAEPDLPTLPGFVAGIERIRSDEGRHVGSGMAKLAERVESGVDPQLLHDTVTELLGLVQQTTTADMDAEKSVETPGPSAAALRTYAAEKHTERMEQITDPDADIPEVIASLKYHSNEAEKRAPAINRGI